ncbi:MAG: hypothetical protein Q4F55_04655 [Bacillota bacterium]|nr:hypothetical protein [Erysipelotrichaceae bacterium]MDO5441828.1 hypothetical protein [Bacillota bacterium]
MNIVKKNLNVIKIINVIVILTILVLNIIKLFIPGRGFENNIILICLIATFCFGLLYAAKGYSKDARKYYQMYMFLASIYYLISIMMNIIKQVKSDYLSLLISAICNIVFVALAFSKDFGEKNSSTVIVLLIVLSIVDYFVYGFVVNNFSRVVGKVSDIALILVGAVFVACKYSDKDRRYKAKEDEEKK